MIFGWITSCSGSSALLVGPASARRPSNGYRESLIVTRKGSLRRMGLSATCAGTDGALCLCLDPRAFQADQEPSTRAACDRWDRSPSEYNEQPRARTRSTQL